MANLNLNNYAQKGARAVRRAVVDGVNEMRSKDTTVTRSQRYHCDYIYTYVSN